MRIFRSIRVCLPLFAAVCYGQALWVQQGQPFVNTTLSAIALSADGNTAIVGALPNTTALPAGGGWVYTRSSRTWSLQAQLTPTSTTGKASVGFSVAISGDGNTIALGGIADSTNAGAVWIFVRSGNSWTQQTKLTGTGASTTAAQGYAVALSNDGNTLIESGPNNTASGGTVWAFTRASDSTWSQSARLVGAGATTVQLGSSLAVSGDGNTVVAGDPSDSGGFGAAWIFVQTAGVWNPKGTKLIGTGALGTPAQGLSVAISSDGSTVLVGGQFDGSGAGAAWVFANTASGWSQQAKLVGSGAVGAARQGVKVGLSADGNIAVSSGSLDNQVGLAAAQGATWTFNRTGSTWTQAGGKLFDASGAVDASQGQQLALSADGKTLAVGGNTGGPNFQPAVWFYVAGLPTTTTLTLPAASPVYGDSVVLQATVHGLSGPGNPTGTVTFRNGSTVLTTASLGSDDTVTVTIPPFPAGSYDLSAQYNGDIAFATSTGTGAQSLIVQKAAATITTPALVSGAPVFGQVENFQSTVSGRYTAPTGTISLFDGSQLVTSATVNVSGLAVLSTSNLGPGSHALTALYNGDQNYLASPQSAAFGLTVTPAAAPANVTASAVIAPYGQTVTFTAVFTGASGAPVGGSGVSTTFLDGTSVLCASVPVTNGQAACAAPGPLSLGAHIVSVSTLAGDARYVLGKVAPTTVTVLPATTTTVSGPATFPQGTGIFTAQIAVTPAGAASLAGPVSFTVNGSPVADCQKLLVNSLGLATCAVPAQPGSNTIGAAYAGDSLRTASSGSLTTTVVPNSNLLAVLNGASYSATASAAGEIVALFGTNLANAAGQATVQITDNSGTPQAAQVFYASPTQINCILPGGLAVGGAMIAVGNSATAAINISSVAPGVFSANASGQGTAAANVLRVHSDGTSATTDASQPISLDPSTDKIYIVLYGTGIRGVSGLTGASVTINGLKIPVLYAGVTSGYPGLDQVNVGPLPTSLKGSGTVNVVLIVDSHQANTVTLTIQ